jgi:hypothetical protein
VRGGRVSDHGCRDPARLGPGCRSALQIRGIPALWGRRAGNVRIPERLCIELRRRGSFAVDAVPARVSPPCRLDAGRRSGRRTQRPRPFMRRICDRSAGRSSTSISCVVQPAHDWCLDASRRQRGRHPELRRRPHESHNQPAPRQSLSGLHRNREGKGHQYRPDERAELRPRTRDTGLRSSSLRNADAHPGRRTDRWCCRYLDDRRTGVSDWGRKVARHSSSNNVVTMI